MSLAHTKLAWKCYQFSGKTMELLLALAHRAGTGKTMGNGHTVPFGQVRATDKVLMKDLRTRRRQTIYLSRKELVAAGVITWELIGNTFGKKNTYPVHLYQFNLDKLTELSVAKTATRNQVRKTLHTDVRKTLHADGVSSAKNATQRVDSRLVGNNDPLKHRAPDGVGEIPRRSVAAMRRTSDSGSGALPAPDADAEVLRLAAGERNTTPTHSGVSQGEQEIPEWEMEEVKLALGLEKEWKSLFPAKPSDPEHFWQLLAARGHSPELLFQVIQWFPVSNWTLKINSTADFMTAFKNGILPSFENYHDKIEETNTHAHAAAWVEQCRAARLARAEYERWTPAVLGPAHPADAAEEESWYAADDLIDQGFVDDPDPMFDPWAGERDQSEYDPNALFDPDGKQLCELCGKECDTGSPCDACLEIEKAAWEAEQDSLEKQAWEAEQGRHEGDHERV